MLKKLSLSAAALAAAVFCSGAAQAGAVIFDPTGGSGAVATNVYSLATLDWAPDNALSLNALSGGVTPTGAAAAAILPTESYFKTVAQGVLGTFGATNSAGVFNALISPSSVSTKQFTFQTSFYEFGSSIGAQTSSFRLAPEASAAENFFRIYADTANANQITGLGYNGGTLILEGKLTSVSGSFTDNSRTAAGTLVAATKGPIPPASNNNYPLLDSYTLDGSGDNQNGTLTHRGQGSNELVVEVTSLNSSYFLNAPTLLVLDLNYLDTTNLTDPFISANPSNQIVGETPYYSVRNATGAAVGGNLGKRVNGDVCNTLEAGLNGQNENGGAWTGGGNRCDYHFQTDASGSFVMNDVPEPGALALLGLALGAAGLAGRRRKA